MLQLEVGTTRPRVRDWFFKTALRGHVEHSRSHLEFCQVEEFIVESSGKQMAVLFSQLMCVYMLPLCHGIVRGTDDLLFTK